MALDFNAVEQTLRAARAELLAARTQSVDRRPGYGHWVGELSSSALSTATAVCALQLLDRATGSEVSAGLVRNGVTWLVDNINADGGWGDTVDSPSNISTTALCWAALGVNHHLAKAHHTTVEQAQDWLAQRAGRLNAEHLAEAIDAVYGEDRTFSVPILTMCALAGRFGKGRQAWSRMTQLPFELAVFPRGWFHRLGLPVVSYALPALIAIGQARHHHSPTRNPIMRWIRHLTRARTLNVLQSVQPQSGGFLEAAPLTSFVLMSLASIGEADHQAARKAAAFLADSVREDGSWPIDTNLATWVTTLSINALAAGNSSLDAVPEEERSRLRDWLLDQQHLKRHPYTYAAPGGWAWTNLSGGVPDADDTPGALLALQHLTMEDTFGNIADERLQQAIESGMGWLLDLQNKDGGIPTFCRGWGKLPFDRSSPDLTAHTLRGWDAWRDCLPDGLRNRVTGATRRAVEYLIAAQQTDGAWVPLWFGNQSSANQRNPLYGTTRVLRASNIALPDGRLSKGWLQAQKRGLEWVLPAQNSDGGWGGDSSAPSSVEETALAVEALVETQGRSHGTTGKSDAIERGTRWLIDRTRGGTVFAPAPIGLYFAKLWYSEHLYPLIFTVAALQNVLNQLTNKGLSSASTQT
ncbi:MAG: hypothetical protein JSU63_02950 [Phycisphaerales bacterium]|nr:MAG: hypothetical protein JSU63_02950 [Phycisphaerales bacterium]